MGWYTKFVGPKTARGLIVVGIFGNFCGYVLPNTIFVEEYKKITRAYEFGLPIRVSAKVNSLFEEVKKDMNFDEKKSNIISCYTAFGCDLTHAGSLKLSTGVVGIPDIFKHTSVNFNPSGLLIDQKEVAWDSPDGQHLKDALILSNEAKKFAIARDISRLSMYEPFVKGGMTSATLLLGYGACTACKHKFQPAMKLRGVKIVFYSVFSLMTYVILVLYKDVLTFVYEIDSDSDAANISETYLKGGIEYYEKILKRNVSMRALMGENGQHMYTAGGNAQIKLRTKHAPFTDRLQRLQSKLEEYSEKAEEKTEDQQPAVT